MTQAQAQESGAPERRSAQIEFARHNYDSQQNIIRHLDIKAGAFISLLTFFVLTAPQIGHDIFRKLKWGGAGTWWSAVYVISGFVLVLAFLSTAYCIQRVIRVRGLQVSGDSPGLLLANDILRFGNSDQYCAAIGDASEQVILKNYATEVFLLSVIVRDKAKALGVARWPTAITFGAWVVNTMTALYISTWI